MLCASAYGLSAFASGSGYHPDADDYVAISCRLLDDPGFYQQMREAIHQRKPRLFHDKSVAEAFQVAVETVCRQAPVVGQQPSGSRPLPISNVEPAGAPSEPAAA